jgi:glycosyltransferase involved in cell wall biosynthesis
MSIFISVASYRDPDLLNTVKSLFNNADRPQDLVFGIVNQDQRGKHEDFSWLGDQTRVHNMHYKDARGAGYARKIAMELYDGEDFFFQVDSHMRFAQGWDTKLIGMYNWCVNDADTNKVILSQFTAPFIVGSDGKDYYIHDDPDFWDRPSWTSVVNTWAATWAGHREEIEDLSVPAKSHTVLCGLLFTSGDFVEEIPYDERISFMGEELCIALRAYTRGWHIYAPHEMVAWHFYKREERPKIWKDNVGGRSWTDIEMNSQKVQKSILLGEDHGVYGIGDYDKYLEYQRLIGIDFTKFYEEEINKKVNLGLITTETEFDENFNMIQIAKTGYCTKGLHSQCLAKDNCDCTCHKGEIDE